MNIKNKKNTLNINGLIIQSKVNAIFGNDDTSFVNGDGYCFGSSTGSGFGSCYGYGYGIGINHNIDSGSSCGDSSGAGTGSNFGNG